MTPAAPIRIGILGCAGIVKEALLDAAREVPEVSVVAIASRTLARSKVFATQHGIKKYYGSYEALLSDPNIDAVYLPLPNNLHCEWAIRALNAGKPVLCEKPIAANAEQASRMAQAARSAKLPLVEAFHYRYHPVAQRIEEIVASGALGALRHVEGRFWIPASWVPANNIRLKYELAGGAVMDPGCYVANILRMVTCEEPTVVHANLRMGSANVDLAAEARLAFPSGCTGRIESSLAHDSDQMDLRLRVVGAEGELIVINPFLPQIGHELQWHRGGQVEITTLERTPTFVFQLREFANVIRHGTPVRTTIDDGIKTMLVLDAIYRAAGVPLRGTLR